MAAKSDSEMNTHQQLNEPEPCHTVEPDKSTENDTRKQVHEHTDPPSESHHTAETTDDTNIEQSMELDNIEEPTKSKDSTQIVAESASSIRYSQRNINKTKVDNFQIKTDAQSQYYRSTLRELQDTSVNTNYSRLADIKSNLEKSIAEIHREYSKLNDEVSGAPKPIGLEVDRLTHDNTQLVNRVETLMNHLSIRPRNVIAPQKSNSLKSQSTRTSTSKVSTNSSSSSKLRRKAHEARAAEEVKKAELRMLAIQEEQETELAELKLRQELQLAKKQREIQRTKLQSEITAEQIRRQVLELAAREEETGVTSLMSQLPSRAPSVVIVSSEVQTNGQMRNEATTINEPESLQQIMETSNPSAMEHDIQQTMNQRQTTPSHQNTSRQHDNHIQELNISHQGQITPNSDHASIAEAIIDAINYATECPKLEAPKPFIYTGKLTDYPDWKASVNRFILDRKGRPEDKLALLRTYLSTDHHKLINAYCTIGNEYALKEALKALDEEFGDEFQVGKAYKQELHQWPQVTANDPKALKDYLGFLKQCSAAMVKISSLKDLNTLSEQQKIIKKLPTHLGRKWIHKTTKHHECYGEWPSLADLCTFLKYEVKVACNPLNDTNDDKKIEKRNKEANNKTRSRGTSHAIESKASNKSKHCIKCEKQNHFTSDCGFLVRLSEEDKQKFIASNNLCFYCLNKGHSYKECKTPVKCQISGCDAKHATVNHNKLKKNKNDGHQNKKENKQSQSNKPQQGQDKPAQPNQHEQQPNKQPAQQKTPSTTESQTMQSMTPQSTQPIQTSCHSIRSAEEAMSMLIMPVYVGYKKSSMELLTYALVDSMSDRSFISEDLVNKLNISPSDTAEQSMMLHTMNQQTEVINRQIKGLKLRGYREQYTIKLPTMTTTADEIPINKDHIPTKKAAEKWKHLRHISDKLPPPMNINVGILLGANVNAAHTPLEIIVNTPEEPYAKRTVLGWSITGNHNANTTQNNNCFTHRITTKEVQDDNLIRKEVVFVTDPSLPTSQQILDILESDFQPTDETTGPSIDDKLFMTLLFKETHKDETTGHITMPLPFKQRPRGLGLKTKKSAEHRFNLLLQRFEKDKEYGAKYKDFMKSIISNGDAELVENHKDNAWYIPHFGVFHPKKPGKIRVVFDCAAKTDGKSLNDYLLAGPDMMNSLLGILMRFRQEKVALSCDIERMFHQFHVNEDDRDYLRFFWLTENNEKVTYRMKVHLFGAKSSPACATFGLRYLAETYANQKLAQEFIASNFYVDDGLASTSNVDTATLLIEQAIDLCKKGNIRLHKFVTNSSELLASIPETERDNCSNVNLLDSDNSMHRTLGIQWNTSSDEFSYKLSIATKNLTRRGILSAVASIFDPLGLISPYIITGKMILQQCCKRSLEWDEQLPVDLANQWMDWINTLEGLKSIEFPRCYKPTDFGTVVKAELHSFSDASNNAYGAAIYLRLVDTSGKVTVTLVHAKARTAPSSITTIPRLELQAAVLSTLLTDFVRKELTNYDINKAYYYTDSRIVLGYLNNDTRRFQVFVANRAQKIRNYTKPSDWHYVPTKLNPADHASRGLKTDKSDNSLWKQGPSFLASEPIQLPVQPNHLNIQELRIKTKDIKKSAHTHACMAKDRPGSRLNILETLKSIPSWNKMIHLISSLEQYKRFLSNKYLKKLEIKSDVEAQLSAEKTIIKLLQHQHYGEDAEFTSHKQLRKLQPFLDLDGILRVGGRLDYSHHLEYEEKHPIILPKDPITMQLARHYHALTGHQGRRSTLAQLHIRGYWIVGRHSMISSLINSCTICKRLRANLQGQQMAPIPEKRIEPSPPFTYVGCDIFGPFLVKDRRSVIKRYGAIFICMASKAIHIEMVDDMSTDAFLNTLRCLIAIRGPVRQLHTDRGTNFIGAANELHKQMQSGKLSSFTCDNHIEFVTNVPYASHMGGIWERQIRSIRAVMDGLLKGHHSRLDSSSLRTLFYEIMAIINCRPLTMTDEGMPLHPNMILTLKSAIVLPPSGDFDAEDVYNRKRWIQVQGMAAEFWKRWRVEYLQTLQQRQKWKSQKPNLKVGDIVIVKEPDTNRNHWPLGKIEEVMPSADGLVRKVKLRQTSNRPDKLQTKGAKEQCIYERPAHKVVLIYRPEQT